jgi:hypothetical protein
MIHLSDSIGRFYPISPSNERYEAGLWHGSGDAGNYYKNGSPSHERIEKARENMHAKHLRTIFVNAHMAMLYYDPANPRPVGPVAEASPRTALTLSRAETAPIQSVFRSAARRSSATSTEWVRAPDGGGDLFQALRT